MSLNAAIDSARYSIVRPLAEPSSGVAPLNARREGVRSGEQNVYVVTCGTCGQTWQRTTARTGDASECVFCGAHGWIRLGPSSTEDETRQRIEAWLEPPIC
jgi:Zn ribbon nucleic-acid-binding protein